jgi:ABC-type xylose transport system permease subunit
MNTLVWVVMLVVLGLVTGKVVGALTAFTHAPAVYDLLAGSLGAIAGGVLLRSIGPISFHAPLLTLLTGVGAAFLATWLTRIATWAPEPTLQQPEDASPYAGTERQRHDVMTTGEATTFLLRHGRLVEPQALHNRP